MHKGVELLIHGRAAAMFYNIVRQNICIFFITHNCYAYSRIRKVSEMIKLNDALDTFFYILWKILLISASLLVIQSRISYGMTLEYSAKSEYTKKRGLGIQKRNWSSNTKVQAPQKTAPRNKRGCLFYACQLLHHLIVERSRYIMYTAEQLFTGAGGREQQRQLTRDAYTFFTYIIS